MNHNLISISHDFTIYVNENLNLYKQIFTRKNLNIKTNSYHKINKFLKTVINLNKFSKKGDIWVKYNKISLLLMKYDEYFSEIYNLILENKVIILKTIYYIRMALKEIKKDDKSIKITDSENNISNFNSSDLDFKKIALNNSEIKSIENISTNNSEINISLNNNSIKKDINNIYVLFNKNKGDIKNFNLSINHLKSMFQIFNVLHDLIDELQKDYFHKINSYNLYDKTSSISIIDLEYNNKLLDTTFKQFDSIIKSNNKLLFSETESNQTVKIFLSNGKFYNICTIDYLRIRKIEHNYCYFLIIDIGKNNYKLQYFKPDFINENCLNIMKFNFKNIKEFLDSIISNQKIIKYWINFTNKIVRDFNKI